MTAFAERLISTGIPLALVGVPVTALAYLLARNARGHAAARLAVTRTLLSFTVIALLWWALLLRNPRDSDARALNLVPFREILRALRSTDATYGAINFWGNVVVFVPIGALVVMSIRRRRWEAWRIATVFGLALSLSIEAIQFAIGRSADVDDLLLNGLGAAVGAVLGVALRRLLWRRGEARPTE